MRQRQFNDNFPLVLKVPLDNCQTFTILVIVATGSKFETAQEKGVSHFLEHMFFKGTTKRPTTLAISSELDAIGGEYNAFTSKESTAFYVKCVANQAEVALDVLSDMLLNSLFASEEIDKERGVIIEEINMYEDNPLMHLSDVFERVLYGDTPAGWDTAGSKETVNSLKRENLIDYWQTHYGHSRAIICLAGNLSPDVDTLVNKYFSQWPTTFNFRDKLPVINQQTEPQLLVENKTTDQVHLALGVPAFPYGHPAELPTKLLAAILGGTMSSRLFLEIRERRGLAYYVRTEAETYTDSGYLVTEAGVKKESLPLAISMILQEYKKLTTELVEEGELNRVKKFLSGRLILGLEGSDDLARWYGYQQALRLGQGKNQATLDTPQDYLTKLNSVSATDIREVARQIFVDKGLNLAIIGPVANQNKLVSLLTLD